MVNLEEKKRSMFVMENTFHPYFHYVNIKVKQKSPASLNMTIDNENESSCCR